MRLLSSIRHRVFEASAQSPSHPLDSPNHRRILDRSRRSPTSGPSHSHHSLCERPPASTRQIGCTQLSPRPTIHARGRRGPASAVKKHLPLGSTSCGKKFSALKSCLACKPPSSRSELFGEDEAIKSDPRVVEALKKRGITDLGTVSCIVLPGAYQSIPEQATQRMGFGECAQRHGVFHSWGRAIEGLSLQVNMATKKVLKVVDTEVVPVPTGNIDYEGIPENPRPHTTPISISQPAGPATKSRTVRSPGRTGSSACASISALARFLTWCASSTKAGHARFFTKPASASYSSPTWIRRTGGTIASSWTPANSTLPASWRPFVPAPTARRMQPGSTA